MIMFSHKFNETAYLCKAMLSSDSEQSRGELRKKPFQCYEFDLLSTNQHTPIEKMLTKTQTTTICTYDEIAITIESDDTIEYNKVLYSVVSVKKLKNIKNPHRFDYLITMQLGG